MALKLWQNAGRKFAKIASLPPRKVFTLATPIKHMPSHRKPYGLTSKNEAGRNLEVLNDYNDVILDDVTFPENHNRYNDKILAAYNMGRWPWDD